MLERLRPARLRRLLQLCALLLRQRGDGALGGADCGAMGRGARLVRVGDACAYI